MWEMIEQMASNRLWIYTALVGSLFGLAFSTYFKGTRIGLWLYSKFDRSVDYLVERFGWTLLEQPEDDWTNLEVIIEVGKKWNRPITDEEAGTIETVQDIFDIINN